MCSYIHLHNYITAFAVAEIFREAHVHVYSTTDWFYILFCVYTQFNISLSYHITDFTGLSVSKSLDAFALRSLIVTAKCNGPNFL